MSEAEQAAFKQPISDVGATLSLPRLGTRNAKSRICTSRKTPFWHASCCQGVIGAKRLSGSSVRFRGCFESYTNRVGKVYENERN
jgi:hypothetical protein